jgi:hypothetical protein
VLGARALAQSRAINELRARKIECVPPIRLFAKRNPGLRRDFLSWH